MATELVGTTLDNTHAFSGDVEVELSDSPSIDSFSRARMSQPAYIFDSQFQYDLQPLLYETVTAQSGATVAHDATNSCAIMTFSSTPTGGKAYMQTHQYFRYQSGRSQLIFATFNFIEPKANTLKFIGYGDSTNGVFLEQSGSTVQFKLYSSTDDPTETIAQSAWNLDKMDGYGASGIFLDLTKTQILVIDLQWLGVGRVRIGFDIDGVVTYCHEFLHANLATVPYMATANLPVRAGMTCTGTVSTTMRFICVSVSSEGGQEDAGGYSFTANGSVTAASGARTHILSVRPKTTFNSIANRSRLVVDSVEVLVTGNNAVYWELCLGDVITGTTTFSDVNTTYSATEKNTAGTTSGSPAIVIDSGYVAASATSRGSVSQKISARYPITLNEAGAVRSLGTLTVLVTGLGATSACQASLKWKEIR